MPIKQIIKHIRSNTDIPFYPVESMFYFDKDITSSRLHAYFVNTYVDSGKIHVSNIPSLSEDGLTITYETTYPSSEILLAVSNDSVLGDSWERNRLHFEENSILETTDTIDI